MKTKIYLDDIRTPKDDKWIVVRDYYEFVDKVNELGLENIDIISLDHDLGDTAIDEYYSNVVNKYKLNYKNIKEKTGYDCAKWLVDYYYDKIDSKKLYKKSKKDKITFPEVYVHSANPIGAANIMGYINNFLKNERQKQNCVKVKIPHS